MSNNVQFSSDRSLSLSPERRFFIALGSLFSVLSNGTLLIERTGAADEGRYLCKAENGVGEPVSKLATVDINGNT